MLMRHMHTKGNVGGRSALELEDGQGLIRIQEFLSLSPCISAVKTTISAK